MKAMEEEGWDPKKLMLYKRPSCYTFHHAFLSLFVALFDSKIDLSDITSGQRQLVTVVPEIVAELLEMHTRYID